jgi:hypothetical protein
MTRRTAQGNVTMSNAEEGRPGRKILMLIGAIGGALLAYLIGEGFTKFFG